jgi:sulfur-oxidizing protein SoxY
MPHVGAGMAIDTKVALRPARSTTSLARRRAWLSAWLLVIAWPGTLPQALALAQNPAAIDPAAADPADPFHSLPWPDMRREYLGAQAHTVFDERVQVSGPGFAEDPMNVPITVAVGGLAGVQRIVVLVDRNPIRKVLEYQPMGALPSVSFRFKLEQASPVRAAALTPDGVWHIGSAWVDSSGGGCTVAGATRKDGSWSQTLGLVSGRLFEATPVPAEPGAGAGSATASPVAAALAGARLRLRVMHPMDTGLVGGIPAFHLTKLTVRDARDTELLRIQTFEPVSENPVFSFDFAERPLGPLRISGVDNNGNRVDSRLE